MYFFNTNALAKELKYSSLSEKQKFSYFFGVMIIQAIQIQWMTLGNRTEFNSLSFIYALIYLLIIVLGISWNYRTNLSGDGKAFIERYICLSFPISLKIFILQIILYSVFLILFYTIKLSDELFNALSLVYFFIGYCFIGLFYYLMNSHLRYISK